MKALPFKIPRSSVESLMIQEDKQPYLYDFLHMHPEIQITYILKGTGTVYIGDYIGSFIPDDIYIVGSNVPHVFKNDEEYYESNSDLYAHGMTIFVDESFLNKTLFQLPETSEFSSLLERSTRCLKGVNQKNLRANFENLISKSGLDKMIEVLQIIKVLSNSNSLRSLMNKDGIIRVTENDGKRLNDVVQYTLNNFTQTISLEKVANIANMTVPSFCRFFKQRTRKTYISFITELRINQACKLLTNKDYTILQVAVMTGYNNLSNFNRQFKKVKGITPKEYKSVNSE